VREGRRRSERAENASDGTASMALGARKGQAENGRVRADAGGERKRGREHLKGMAAQAAEGAARVFEEVLAQSGSLLPQD